MPRKIRELSVSWKKPDLSIEAAKVVIGFYPSASDKLFKNRRFTIEQSA